MSTITLVDHFLRKDSIKNARTVKSFVKVAKHFQRNQENLLPISFRNADIRSLNNSDIVKYRLKHFEILSFANYKFG